MTRRRRTSPPANNQPSSNPLGAENPMESVLQAISAISSLTAKVQGMKDNIANIANTLNAQHQEIEGNHNDIDALAKENDGIREKINALELALAIEKKQAEEAVRNCSLEIYGIDKGGEEDVSALITKVFDKLKLNILPTSIKESSRIVKPKGNTYLLVKLINQEIRDKIVAARRAIPLNDLHSKQIDTKLEKKVVYINECITVENKAILFAAKKLQANGWKYIWAKQGKILARKNKDTRVIQLTDRGMVNNLLYDKPRRGLVFPFSEDLKNMK